MQNKLLPLAEQYAKQNKRQSLWRRIVRVMACVVVFCTTYALILPAITMEQPRCGLEEHTHSDSCYVKLTTRQVTSLTCSYEIMEVHEHTEVCRDENQEFICGIADFVVHEHNELCYDANGILACPLPEIKEHEHTEECYRVQEHEHEESCYAFTRGELICELAETEGHSHTAECMIRGDLVCSLEETAGHTHGENCSETVLACDLTVEPHVHDDGCYSQLVCELPEDENHTHSEACSGLVLNCTLTEQPHVHGNGCYQTHSLCGLPETEGHTHGDSCYVSVPDCGLEETEGHAHGDSCYEQIEELACQPELICEKTVAEEHVHGEGCFVTEEVPLDNMNTLTCGLEEDESHTHTDRCYGTWELICGKEEHTHSEECMHEPEVSRSCGMEPHRHSEECLDEEGNLNCALAEHTHDVGCYADLSADIEDAGIWEATLPGNRTGIHAEDLLTVARSQLGYTESAKNYIVDSGEIRGYTRYGAWYGDPYGDWSAMFVSFCLHYAGIDKMPTSDTSADWIALLENAGLYVPAAGYTPETGDIVFFGGNDGKGRVGIVAAYSPAENQDTAQIQCIEGDSDNAVSITTYYQTDLSILGYGLLPGKERLPEVEEEYHINTDINLGPVVTLTAEEKVSEETAAAGRMRFAAAPRSTTDLKNYLANPEVNGSFFLTLTDENHNPLPKDENGNYIVEPDVPYELTLTVQSPKGFAPGTYTYQLPAGLTIQNGTGDLVTDKNVKLGTWSIDENGLITLVFNQDANQYTNVKLSAQMGILFKESDTSIQFDGDITVVIKKPPEEEELKIEMVKWGGSEDGKSITWQVRVVGHEGANIAGTLVTDTIKSGNHSYTDQNRNNTIVIDATRNGVWHSWIVTADDPNLIYWTGTGWQYRMPETATCRACGQTFTLADDCTYDFYYTTTPEQSDSNGTVYYLNRAEFGGNETDGNAQIKYSTGPVGVHKTGSFQGDGEGGKFVWTVKVQLPGMSAGQKAVYNWRLTDGMNIKDANGTDLPGNILKPHNDMDLSVVTITRNGVTTTLNRIENATEADEIVWSSDEVGENGYIQWIDFYCRCHCTEATCPVWENGACNEQHVNGFCKCWTIPDDVVIDFTYETKAPPIIEDYGETGKLITNLVELWYGPNWQAGSGAEVKIPSMFEKTLTDDFGSNDPNQPGKRYIASYTITVNEAKQDISPNGTPITIIDEMTDSLVYIAGSMVITEEDINGNTRVLTYGTDYTLTYDGSDRDDHMHILTIELMHPKQTMYTLQYDTSFNTSLDFDKAPSYQNWAKVTIWGKNLEADTEEKIFSSINFAAKSYQVDIVKTADGTHALLSGATFGLYNEAGGLIVSQTTNENGKLSFITSITDGIILLEHTPYYIQEIEAPEGYMLDTTKYWFYFCDQSDGCTQGSGIQAQHPGAVRIPGNQVQTFNLTNTMYYELPETGGAGTTSYTVGGLLIMLMAAATLLYNHSQKRRKEERPSF